MSVRFFDFDYERSSSFACAGRNRWRRDPGAPWAPHPLTQEADSDLIRDLKHAAIEHRRLLFQLGEKHKIKLHYGACLSMTEILIALYLYWMDCNPTNVNSPTRDRFVLSKGHAAPALYLSLYQAGFVCDEDFRCYRTLGSIFQGHPDRNKTPGVDCTTGSLGQGLGVATGLAWGYRQQGLTSSIYCLVGDGECNEGSIWESALIATNATLDNLVVIVDRNGKSSFGTMKGRNDIEPLGDKWRSFGWDTQEIDGHSFEELTKALWQANSQNSGRPQVIIAQTTKGRGIPFAEQNFVRSNSFLSAEHLAESRLSLDDAERMLAE